MSLPAVLLVTLSRFPSAFRLDSTKVVPAPTPMALQIPYRAILVLAIPKTFLLVQLVVPLSMVWYYDAFSLCKLLYVWAPFTIFYYVGFVSSLCYL